MARNLLGIRLKLDRVEIDQVRATAPGSTIYEAHVRAAEKLVAEAKREAPKRSGAMAEAIDYEIRGLGRNLSAIVGVPEGLPAGDNGSSPSDYVIFVNEGTSGPIVPTESPVLVIRDGRGPVYHAKVSGQAANPFLARALKKLSAKDWSQ